MKRAILMLALEILLQMAGIDTPPEVELVVSVVSLNLIEVMM